MKKEHRYLEYILVGLILVISQYFLTDGLTDEIWNFSFAKNIAEGMVPYKDFHMLQTPLFVMIESIFLFFFGKKLIIFHIVNAILVILIYKELREYNKLATVLCFCIFLPFFMPSYSLMTLLLFIWILKEEFKKDKNHLFIGFLLAITFFTKQNIGVVLSLVGFLPLLFHKEWKSFYKRICGFLLATIPFLLYFLITGSLYDFIDHTIFGLLEFTGNHVIRPTVVILILTIIYLIYKIKTDKKKRLIYFYFLAYQALAFPLIDGYHVMIATIPVFIYFVANQKLIEPVIYKTAFGVFLLIFSILLVRIWWCDYSYTHGISFMKYKSITDRAQVGLKNVANYLKESDKKIIIFDETAILFQLIADQKIEKYDFLLDGNMGYHGGEKMLEKIDEMCKKESCQFMMWDNEEMWDKDTNQVNKRFYYYVKENYQPIGRIEFLTIYE